MPISRWILGYDCAVQDKNSGLARGRVETTPHGTSLWLEESVAGKDEPVIEVLLRWLDLAEPVVLAIDAPLGWPAALGDLLAGHQAGAPLDSEADRLFRRETDRVVRRLVGRQTLDVGADRIARTAHRALDVLSALRERSGRSLTVAVTGADAAAFGDVAPTATDAVIEAYPAGWLEATSRRTPGYRSDAALRRRLFDSMWAGRSACSEEAVCRNPHVFDATLCLCVGHSFMRGACVPPEEEEVSESLVRREGWICLPRRVRKRSDPG
jgi:hypothetical protein